jgi:hypothetical protein
LLLRYCLEASNSAEGIKQTEKYDRYLVYCVTVETARADNLKLQSMFSDVASCFSVRSGCSCIRERREGG